MSTVASSTFINPMVKDIARRIVALFKNTLVITGVLSMLLISIATGPFFINNGYNRSGSFFFMLCAVAVSIVLSVSKFTAWEKFHSYQTLQEPRLRIFLPVIAGAFMLADGLLDIGFVTQWLYPELSDRTIIPPAEFRTLDWWLFVGIIGLNSLLGELMLVWLLNDRTIIPGPEPTFQIPPPMERPQASWDAPKPAHHSEHHGVDLFDDERGSDDL